MKTFLAVNLYEFTENSDTHVSFSIVNHYIIIIIFLLIKRRHNDKKDVNTKVEQTQNDPTVEG